MLVVLDRDGDTVCTIGALNETDSTWRPTDQANARLMATAPTMYNALRAIHGKLDPGILASPEEVDWACRVAQDAMKKARGIE
jgi:hypothetical protein